jgi:putative transposase
VGKRRRLDGIDQIVLSLSARGLATGEIARTSPRYMAPRWAAIPSPGATGKVIEEMT